MKKRIFSAFLSAALLLGLTPWAALAAENPATQVEEQELQTSFQAPPRTQIFTRTPSPAPRSPRPQRRPQRILRPRRCRR